MLSTIIPGYKTRPVLVGRPGGWTGPGLIKDKPGQQLGKTRSTWQVNP